jgi:hypothetical protein
MMSLNFHALWYTTSMHYISWFVCIFFHILKILMCPFQLTSIDFKMQCIALEWLEDLCYWRWVRNSSNVFFLKCIFKIVVLDFDIYTMISTKHLHSQYPILHQSSKLYYWAKETCTIMTNEKQKMINKWLKM